MLCMPGEGRRGEARDQPATRENLKSVLTQPVLCGLHSLIGTIRDRGFQTLLA